MYPFCFSIGLLSSRQEAVVSNEHEVAEVDSGAYYSHRNIRILSLVLYLNGRRRTELDESKNLDRITSLVLRSFLELLDIRSR